MTAMPQIFLSYAREDREKVENLYENLSNAGFKPWMDTRDLLPGERWEASIEKAIKCSDFFLTCLSLNSIDKRGWFQREIKQALDIWQGMLDSDIYLIPARLEDCQVPERLRDFQWVNLFEEDGWTQLAQAIRVGMERRAIRDEPTIVLSEEGPELVIDEIGRFIVTDDGRLGAQHWLTLPIDEQTREIEAALRGNGSWRHLVQLLINGFQCSLVLRHRAMRYLRFLHRNFSDNRVLHSVCRVMWEYEDPEIRLPILEWVSNLQRIDDDLISDIIFVGLADDRLDVRAQAVDVTFQLCRRGGIHLSQPAAELLSHIKTEAERMKTGYNYLLGHVEQILSLQLSPEKELGEHPTDY